jgi:hypothetical protein
VLTDGHGIPLGCVVAPANRHDSPLLRPTLEKLGRFGFDLPPTTPCTNSWHNRGFKKLQVCTERRTRVIDALIALANAIIIVRRLIRRAWTTHRWHNRPGRRP